MTINDPAAHLASQWDWHFLTHIFTNEDGSHTRIRVSDVDGIFGPGMTEVETRQGICDRFGHFLFFETKGEGVSITNGQFRMHNELRKKCFTIIYIWGQPNNPTKMQIWWAGTEKPDEPVEPATLQDIIDAVKIWWKHGNALCSTESSLEYSDGWDAGYRAGLDAGFNQAKIKIADRVDRASERHDEPNRSKYKNWAQAIRDMMREKG